MVEGELRPVDPMMVTRQRIAAMPRRRQLEWAAGNFDPLRLIAEVRGYQPGWVLGATARRRRKSIIPTSCRRSTLPNAPSHRAIAPPCRSLWCRLVKIGVSGLDPQQPQPLPLIEHSFPIGGVDPMAEAAMRLNRSGYNVTVPLAVYDDAGAVVAVFGFALKIAPRLPGWLAQLPGVSAALAAADTRGRSFCSASQPDRRRCLRRRRRSPSLPR